MDIRNLDTWFKANMLSLNLAKTYVMQFWPKTSASLIKIKLGEVMLPTMNNIKFLGATIDNKMNWTKHINNILTKLSVNKNLLGKSRNLMNKDAKKHIYHAYIYSHLTYVNTVWSNHGNTKQKRLLKKIQKYCIRSITNSKKNSHADPMFKSLEIMKIDEKCKYKLCKLAYRVKEKLLPEPILEIFDSLGKEKHHYATQHKHLPNIKKHTGSE